MALSPPLVRIAAYHNERNGRFGEIENELRITQMGSEAVIARVPIWSKMDCGIKSSERNWKSAMKTR